VIRVPLPITVDVAKALPLDGHPEEIGPLENASITYSSEVAMQRSAWLSPIGSWPSNIDLLGKVGGLIKLQGFPGSVGSGTAQLDIQFELSLTPL
jgi:hypothetical protein